MPRRSPAPSAPAAAAPAPPTPRDTPPPALLAALEAVTRAHPVARKRFLAPELNFGRECLAALARRLGGWVGWESATLRSIADELAFVAMHERGCRVAGDIELGALVQAALDRAIAAERVSGRLTSLRGSVGFARALRDAVMELRIADVTPAQLAAVAEAGSPAAQLPAILEEYERLLHAANLADPAAVFALALESFAREAPYVLDGVTVVSPVVPCRGIPGRLLERIVEHGARLLPIEPLAGIDVPASLVAGRASREDPSGTPRALLAWVGATAPPPDEMVDRTLASVDVFAAASPADELVEVLRRAVAEGWRLDDIEIATTDSDAYGIALDAISRRLEMGATMLRGIPLARTRLGRALVRWRAWLADGLPADVLREALEAGELRSPDEGMPAAALARRLRELRIGWGRTRYERAIARLGDARAAESLRPYSDEAPEALEKRRAWRRREESALRALLAELLDAAPVAPERGATDQPVVAPAVLARGTLRWIALVPVHGPAETMLVERLTTRLEELARIGVDAMPFSGALAVLEEAIGDVRAWPHLTSERSPWVSAGGVPHLTDAAHAGITGRPRIFVVGLDADRTRGASGQDPMLPDDVRRALGDGRLPTRAERREEEAFRLANALAGLRGRVTLSYATRGAADGREAGPSAVLLHAWRLTSGNPEASFQDLREALRPPACAVPGAMRLDRRDAWLGAIGEGALLLDGEAVVREAHPLLDAGLRAVAAAEGEAAGAYHGLVAAAAGRHDPRQQAGRALSPSSLEKLAACPLAWFYGRALGVRAPDDPDYDPERWLDHLRRGSLLHEVFERFARDWGERREALHGDEAAEALLAILRETIDAYREEDPPASLSVFEAECAALERDTLGFLAMERELSRDGARWLHVELAFGFDGATSRYELPDGEALQVLGRIDRVDEMPDGTLRVVDYKTGSSLPYTRRHSGAFGGGRRLQPAIYASAVGALLGRTVSEFQYRFPTERGAHEVISFRSDDLLPAARLVTELLEHLRHGQFVPTNDSNDCRFCDYRDICRVSDGQFNKLESPRAKWAKEHGPALDVYRDMIRRRG